MTILALLGLGGCQPTPASKSKPAERKSAPEAASIGGDPAAGRQLFVAKGCVACHKAPNVPEAQGVVGPDLKGVGSHPKLGAGLDNTPENMKRWIMDPQAIKPGTSMPSLGLSDAEATNLVSFLETLK